MISIPTSLKKSIQNLTGPIFAHKPTGGEAIRMRNETVYRNARRFGVRFMSWGPVQRAFENDNLKVTPSLYKKSKCTLIYPECDTHEQGNAEGVREYYRRLKEYFPQMLDPVVTDRGGSNWLVIGTRDKNNATCGEREWNEVIEKFEFFCAHLAKDLVEKKQIQMVEVKGKVYTFDYLNNKVERLKKAGDLLKAPPSIEYCNQSVIPFEYLRQLVDHIDLEDERNKKKAEEKKRREAQKQNVNENCADPLQAGSVDFFFSEKEISNLSVLASYIDQMHHDRPTFVAGHQITNLRFAEYYSLIIKLDVNEDGTNPAKRHKALHDALYERGVFQWKFNHKIYKAIRDYLSHCDLIDWQDARYSYDPERKKLGKAAKWSAKTEVRDFGKFILLNGDLSSSNLIDKPKHISFECVLDICNSTRLDYYTVPVYSVSYVRWDPEWYSGHAEREVIHILSA